MKSIEAVFFDMDGTLIINTDSVEYICRLNDRVKEINEIVKKEENGEITWIEADYIKIKLVKGLDISAIEQKFDLYVKLIDGISEVISMFKSKGIRTVLVTAGPIEVAKVIGKKFGFDEVHGSRYEVKGNRHTGKIDSHVGIKGKSYILIKYCKEHDINLENCIAVGDSTSDVDMFKVCGKAIAINYSKSLIGKADYYIRTDNLINILEYVRKIG